MKEKGLPLKGIVNEKVNEKHFTCKIHLSVLPLYIFSDSKNMFLFVQYMLFLLSLMYLGLFILQVWLHVSKKKFFFLLLLI